MERCAPRQVDGINGPGPRHGERCDPTSADRNTRCGGSTDGGASMLWIAPGRLQRCGSTSTQRPCRNSQHDGLCTLILNDENKRGLRGGDVSLRPATPDGLVRKRCCASVVWALQCLAVDHCHVSQTSQLSSHYPPKRICGGSAMQHRDANGSQAATYRRAKKDAPGGHMPLCDAAMHETSKPLGMLQRPCDSNELPRLDRNAPPKSCRGWPEIQSREAA